MAKQNKKPVAIPQTGTLRDYGGGFLILCLAASLVFAYVVVKPFLALFLVALVLAVIARPVYRWLLRRKWLEERESLASALTVVFMLVVLIIPAIGILSLVAKEAYQAYDFINARLQDGAVNDMLQRLAALQEKYLPRLDVDLKEAAQSLAGAAGRVSNLVIKLAGTLLSSLTSSVWKFALMLFALFYVIRDAGKVGSRIKHWIPLPASLEDEIADAFVEVSRSAFYGTFLTALAQGILGGIGFWIAGLPPLVWGLVMALFSMIPMVGTALVWLPAALLLILSHKVFWGVFLIIWGVAVVGMSDNFLRPFLMRGKSELHPMLIFFSLLGGIGAFGFLGILLGPLAIVLLIALLKAYEEAARPILKELDEK